jgi:hypothetical protein
MHPQQGDLAGHLFDEQEFQVLHDILAILEVPHAAQEVLSAEKTPILAMALPAYEMVNESWLNLQIVIPELAHYIGVGIHKINEYITKGRKTRAYALAMSTFFVVIYRNTPHPVYLQSLTPRRR